MNDLDRSRKPPPSAPHTVGNLDIHGVDGGRDGRMGKRALA
ncbi:hypothetical protein [Nonomuraea endophytica]